MNIRIENIYKELAKKHNLTQEKIHEIVYSQFLTVRNAVDEGQRGEIDTFKNIHLAYFGKFAVSETKLYKQLKKFNMLGAEVNKKFVEDMQNKYPNFKYNAEKERNEKRERDNKSGDK